MTTKQPSSFLVRILYGVESIWAFGSGLFLPIFAIFSEQVGGDITDAGIAAALFLFATSTIAWPVSIYLDRFNKKWFIVADYFLEGVVFLGYAFVTTKYQLFGLQILLGIANSIGDPAWESLFDNAIPKKSAGKFWSLSHLWIGYASATGILIGSILADTYGFSIVFLIGAVLSFTAALLSAILIKNHHGKSKASL